MHISMCKYIHLQLVRNFLGTELGCSKKDAQNERGGRWEKRKAERGTTGMLGLGESRDRNQSMRKFGNYHVVNDRT